MRIVLLLDEGASYRDIEEKLRAAPSTVSRWKQRYEKTECWVSRPYILPGVFIRLMLIGFFEGIDSERGIAWRVADSLSLRQFPDYGIDENTPDHVTISRTRRLLDASTHKPIFDWVLEQLAQAGLVKGKTMGVDSTTLEAKSIQSS